MKRAGEAAAAPLAEKFGEGTHAKGISGSRAGYSEAPTTILNRAGDDWRCPRRAGEPDRAFAFRLALYLRALRTAIDDDLARVRLVENEL